MPAARCGPDLVLTCDPRDFSDDHVTRYPKLIVEIVSPSTASADRVAKFNKYRTSGERRGLSAANAPCNET